MKERPIPFIAPMVRAKAGTEGQRLKSAENRIVELEYRLREATSLLGELLIIEGAESYGEYRDIIISVLAKRGDKVARPSASSELRSLASYINEGADGAVNDTIWHTDTETAVDALLRIADEVEV